MPGSVMSILRPVVLALVVCLNLVSNELIAVRQSQNNSIQHSQATDSLLARSLYTQGVRYLKARAFDSAQYYFRNAENIYQKNNSWRSLISVKLFKAMTFRSLNEYDSSQNEYELALEVARKRLMENDSLLANVQLGLGSVYLNKGMFAQALEQYKGAVDIKRHNLGEDHIKVGELFYNIAYVQNRMGDHLTAVDLLEKASAVFIKTLGREHSHNATVINELAITYNRLGNIREAIDHFEQALEIRKKTLKPDDPDMAASYNNLGIMWFDNGQYQKSLDYYERALRIYLKNFSEKHPRTATCLHNIGNAYRETGDYETALGYYHRALKSRREVFGDIHMDVAQSYSSLGTTWLYQLNYQKAKNYQQDALKIKERLLPANHPSIAESHNNLGNALMAMGNFSGSRDHFLKALAIRGEFFSSGKANSLVTTLKNLGFSRLAEGSDMEALENFQRAIIAGSEVSTLNSVFDNPALEEVMFPADVLPVMITKSRTLKRLANTAGTKEEALRYLNAAFSGYQLAIGLIDQVRREYLEIDDLNSFMNEQTAHYTETIDLCRALYEKTDDAYYLGYAFEIAEKSRAFYLSQRLKQSNSTVLPDSLLDIENNLLVEIAFYEKRIKSDTLLTDSLGNVIFGKKRQLEKLIESYENNYPAYYALKYSEHIVSIDKIMSEIPDESTLIEYVWADSLLYSFAVTSDLIDLHVQKIDTAFENSLEKYIGWNSDYSRALKRGKSKQEIRQYNAVSNQLYGRLLSRQLNYQSGKSLIVIPDGPLGRLSFATLNTGEAEAAVDSFSDLPYLIKSLSVRYGFSASILFTDYKKAKNVRKDFVGFAPSYSDKGYGRSLVTRSVNLESRNGLSPLLYNQSEVKKIAEITEGDVFLADEATVGRFREKAVEYNIIHLAAHAILSDSLPEYSGIAFTAGRDDGEDNYLESYELSNLELSADLAVLSACQTAFGPWQNGEGLISLARSFRLAGIQNIIASQWPIDDENTAQIMELFYLKLKSGLPKDMALQQAQVEFFESSVYSHPAFWAAYTLWGDDKVLTWKSENRTRMIIAVSSLLALLIIFFTSRRNKKEA